MEKVNGKIIENIGHIFSGWLALDFLISCHISRKWLISNYMQLDFVAGTLRTLKLYENSQDFVLETSRLRIYVDNKFAV